MGVNPKGYAHPELLITPDELDAVISTSREATDDSALPVVLDLRPTPAFAAGHVPGARHLDLFGVSLIDTDPAPLRAFMWMIAHLLASRGVSAETPVVVYDEQSGVRAARAFWFLEYFRHPDVRLLDGGFGAWQRAGRPVSTEAQMPTSSGWHVPDTEANRLATWRDVLARVGRDGVVMLDTRSGAEYFGTNMRSRRSGVVPGAVHVEWTRNLDETGAFKPASELQAMYEAAGVTPDLEVVAYCQGGYRSAHGYLALRLLGYACVRNYVGSWKEWGDRDDLPIQHPRPDATSD